MRKYGEKERKWNAAYYKRNRARILARNIAWNRANKARVAEVSKVWDKENPERRKSNGLRWQRENPDKVKAIFARHKSRKAKNGGSFSGGEWLSLCKHYGNRCLCCHKRKPLEADHVIPVILGGTSDISNIQPLCRSCNARKSRETTDYRRIKYAKS
jgi:5-methylcytosine-specific restriction endonuclease McrA